MLSLQAKRIGKAVNYTHNNVEKTVDFYREGDKPNTIEARVSSVGAKTFIVPGNACTINKAQLTIMVLKAQNVFVNSNLSVEEDRVGSIVRLTFHFVPSVSPEIIGTPPEIIGE